MPGFIEQEVEISDNFLFAILKVTIPDEISEIWDILLKSLVDNFPRSFGSV